MAGEYGFETIGTVYDFVSLCCKACKVEMGYCFW